MYTIGIDIGSTTSKGILLKDGKEIVAEMLIVAGIGTNGAKQVLEEILNQQGLSDEEIDYVAATGYGRNTFSFADGKVSELSCHAKGVHYLYPDTRTIIDIGGQDAKVMQLNTDGILLNFLMNDKCAAGTGRFLDVMSNILQLPIEQLESKARSSPEPARISSTCTVFAESEVISSLANGEKLENVIAGICISVASRAAALVKRLGVKESVFMSGGVALNGGVRDGLEKELGVKIHYSDKSQMTGALGAALYAYEKKK